MRKIALVTGSRRGIGKGIADLLCENGYTVVYSSTHENMEGVECYKKCDISSRHDRLDLLDYIDKNYGRLDLLVNNAGVACRERLDILETTEESFDRLISINTKGLFFMCQLFAKYMIKCQNKRLDHYNPRIVNITSNSSYTSSISRGEYCVSKAGASMVTKLFADKLAQYDIPVIEVRPGIIKTDMTELVSDKYEKLIAEGVVPNKRWGKPEDIAKTVLAVGMGLLDFSTGTVIDVDGGFNIRRL